MPLKRLKKKLDASDPFRKLVVAGSFMLFMFAVGIFGYRIMGRGEWSMMDCAYMTVTTLSTVGFGEIIDVSSHTWGRAFTLVLILSGTGTILFFVSTLTAFIVEGQLRDLIWRKKMDKALRKLEQHIIICGMGETGLHVADELLANNDEFVMVDLSEDRLNMAREKLGYDIPYIVGDASDDDVLKQAGVERSKGLIAACTDDKDNLFIIVSAKTLNSGIRVVTKAISVQSERKLRRAGADNVVTTNYIGGMRLASEMVRPTVTNFLDRMVREKEKAIRLDEVHINKGSSFVGKSLIDLDIRRMMNLTVLAIEIKEKRKYIFNPEGTFVLDSGMTLICMGEVEHIQKLRKMSGN